MRILSLYYTHKPGGFCTRLYRLLNALAVRGHEVTYLSLDRPPQSLAPTVEFIRIPFPLKTRKGGLFWALFMIWAPLMCAYWSVRKGVSRLVVFGAVYACVALPARILSGARLVLFVRSLVFRINRITRKSALSCWLSDMCEQIGLRAADLVVSMSVSMQKELDLFSGRSLKGVILPNDVPPFTPDTGHHIPQEIEALHRSGKKLVIISGVFDQRKNLALALEAFSLLTEKLPQHPLVLVIAGEGPEIIKAKALVTARELSSVCFTGWLESLRPLYAAASLVLHPSLHEGMPNSVLEAWSQGVPTLLAETGELREMAPEPSLWFPTESAEPLALRLRELVTSPESLGALRDAALRCAGKLRFDWDQQAAELVVFGAASPHSDPGE